MKHYSSLRCDLKEFPIFVAIAKYVPPADEVDGLALEEGDEVEVLDSGNPERWLCRLLGRPDRQGWVPPSYLVARTDEKLDTRTTQEVFREDIIQISNKQQEAVMKRRCAGQLAAANESVPIQLAQCRFPGLGISSAKI